MLKRFDRETYGFPSNKSVYDAKGRELRLWSYDGKLLPPFGDRGPKQMKDLQLRDDDVILCGYPKTGCHWAWEIIGMVARRQAQLSIGGKRFGFLEFNARNLIEEIPSPRVLNTHMWFDYLPKQISAKKTKLILTVRNPKDTAVSLYNFTLKYAYDGSFSDWFQLYMDGLVQYGTYFDYYREWDHVIKSDPGNPILVVSFEDMKEDLPREIRKISKFLEITLEDQLVEDIAKAAGFDVMKTAYQTDVLESFSLRKGNVGDWKKWLTVAQSEMVDEAMTALRGTLFQNPRCTL
ncbi:unnamed protein product [Lymnaea stagnalis]|uniref:Sulfotransferase domain-containing protein n=1 Tax=Lymnaea stagnalis TaxID=6523 RepID=A0AAV2HRK2_LYMST